MPKSKRNKQGLCVSILWTWIANQFWFVAQKKLREWCFFVVAVTLSKTKKKGREHKEVIVNAIRDAAEKYSSLYVFSFENMRNLKFKEFRDQLKSSSRFFLGSNKVMQVALGRSASDEIKPRLYKVSKVVTCYLPNKLFFVLINFYLWYSVGYLSFSCFAEILACFLPICLKKKLKGNLQN